MVPDFIGIYDDVLSKEDCQGIINRIEEFNNNGYGEFRPEPSVQKDDKSFFDHREPYLTDDQRQKVFRALWAIGYDSYAKDYGILTQCNPHFVHEIKAQITKPGGGYHIWHSEVMGSNLYRLLVYIIYLNDIDEGGETEFLYYKKRVQPKAGRLVIFPAYFTHAHRGNTNLSENNKYILTGWYNFGVGANA